MSPYQQKLLERATGRLIKGRGVWQAPTVLTASLLSAIEERDKLLRYIEAELEANPSFIGSVESTRQRIRKVLEETP